MFQKANLGFDKNAPIRRPGAAAGTPIPTQVEWRIIEIERNSWHSVNIFSKPNMVDYKTYLRFTKHVTDTLKYNAKPIPKKSSPEVARKGLERRLAPDWHFPPLWSQHCVLL